LITDNKIRKSKAKMTIGYIPYVTSLHYICAVDLPSVEITIEAYCKKQKINGRINFVVENKVMRTK